MFFESIKLDGIETPRFKKIDLDVKETNQVTETEIQEIALIMKKVFGEWNPERFHSTFKNHNRFYLLTARVDGQAIAFKFGYELDDQEFYSWLGGVLPEYRGLGIATELMKRQHVWCLENGYTKIQTKTKNRFREMLLLNVKSGFQIIGYHSCGTQDAKILMEKNLRRE